MDLNIEKERNNINPNQPSELLDKSVSMTIKERASLIIRGINSDNAAVRNKAQQMLLTLQASIIDDLKKEDKKQGLINSAILSLNAYNYIYNNINNSKLDLNNINNSKLDPKQYLIILLDTAGRGPFYAWKLCQSRFFSIDKIYNIINELPDSCKLVLVNQYLASVPSVRREYAEYFVRILRNIKDQKAVIQFYANLFDLEIPAEIFLENIPLSLRQPNHIINQYVNNEKYSKHERADALKAAAMISSSAPLYNADNSSGITLSFLLELITTPNLSEIHKVVFKIVEKSPYGTYPALADVIMNMIFTIKSSYKSYYQELSYLLDVFKAAAAARHKKLFDFKILEQEFTINGLVGRVKKDIPELMPFILEDTASLSNLSLCFIQEMAEDPSGTLFQKSEIEYALICGIIRKRPERMLKIFEVYSSHPSSDVKNAILKLIEKINFTLEKEKSELQAQFDKVIEDAAVYVQREKEKIGFFKNLFTPSLAQKIAKLKEYNFKAGVDLTNEIIADVDISSHNFLSPGIFTGAVIRDVDLSSSHFNNCMFNNAFFYNVKMNGAVFNKTSFENSVFIDVKAEKAKFAECYFAGASFLNCSFKSADMADAVLADCKIVNTSFSKTELSDATFAGSTITKVSFAESRLEKTDFSGVTGKFCRFSAHILSRAETENSNLYSRIIKISNKDIDKELAVISQDSSLMNEIRFLIFTELIQHGRNMFLLKNRYAVITAFDLFQPDQTDLFELIPLLLHENIDLYETSPRTPALRKLVELDVEKSFIRTGEHFGIQNFDIPIGISDYLPPRETYKIYLKYVEKGYLFKGCNKDEKISRKDDKNNIENIEFGLRHFCYIDALFTMGSIGSIAHTEGSDIDYWVCIREELFDPDSLYLFKKKLNAVETWAKNEFKTEIHFFVVDINRARISDFGNSDSESSGSAQGRLLKEEFYRTMIYLAGKLPFWAVLPAQVCKNYYHDLFIRVCPYQDRGRFIDFGDIHDIPTGEYFGASVWQMFKYLKSPFKSVLKMGLLEKYIYDKKNNRTLLCNEFKTEWMNPGISFNLTKSDPYYILLDSLVTYYSRINSKHPFAKFVQSCFFSKIAIPDAKSLKKSAFGLKEILINKCIEQWKEWEWQIEDIFKAGNFDNWSYEEMAHQSAEIKRYMVQTYKQCRRIWISSDTSFEKESLLTPRDRTVLGRKMIVQFSVDEKTKVDSILIVSKKSLASGLSITYNYDAKSDQKWLLMHKWQDVNSSSIEKNELLKKGYSIEDIGAWLIHNALYVKDNYIKLAPNPTFVKSSNDIKILFDEMHDFFENEIKKEINNDALCSKSIITSMFISLNFTAPRDSKAITEWSVVYRNSWGEMFSEMFSDAEGLKTEYDIINRVKRDLQLSSIPKQHRIFHIYH